MLKDANNANNVYTGKTIEARDVLPNINRTQAAERAENAIFDPGDLDL